jgi:hypothetical protein
MKSGWELTYVFAMESGDKRAEEKAGGLGKLGAEALMTGKQRAPASEDLTVGAGGLGKLLVHLATEAKLGSKQIKLSST